MNEIKKQKIHYINKGRPRRNAITSNLKGFLCSCNFQEKQCVRESYDILNRYADILYPATLIKNHQKEDTEIEDTLIKEIKSLQSNQSTPHRFQLMDSGAKNFLFIKTTLEHPVELAEYIIKNIYESKVQQTRFLLRLVPIEITCKAYLDDMKKAFQPLAVKYFSNEPKTFSIMYNHRNNDSLNREEVTKIFAETVFGVKSDHKVDLKSAEATIVVEVIRGFAFIGVVPNYLKYKKYNLATVCQENSNVNINKT